MLGRFISAARTPLIFRHSSSQTANSQEGLVHVEKQFEAVPPIERNRETFLAAIAIFKERKPRGYVDFIHSALRYMKEYGVHKDIEVYKSLLNIFPKGKLIPQNQWQKMFLHYPLQQNCCVKVLDEMEWHGVHPDKEIHDIVVNAFDIRYLDRRKVEGKTLSQADLAGLALKMMSRDPGSTFHFWQKPGTSLSDSLCEWVAYSQSILQQNLISQMKPNSEIYVDGPFEVYVMEHRVKYATITTSPIRGTMPELSGLNWFAEWEKSRRDKYTIHEQKHETILALACLSTMTNAHAGKLIDLLTEKTPYISQMAIRLRLDKAI